MPRSSKSYAEKRRISDEMLERIGKRVRWVREAYDAREPGQHTQQMWADALGINGATLSRWENGKMLPMVDIFYRFTFLTGADFNYLFFGVLSARMIPWLRDQLAQMHPAELHEEAAFFRDRDRIVGTGSLHRAQKQTRRPAPEKS